MIFKVGSSFDVGPDQRGFLLRRDDIAFMASPSDALLGLDSAHSLWYMVDDIVVLFVSQGIFRWFAFKSCADLAGGGLILLLCGTSVKRKVTPSYVKESSGKKDDIDIDADEGHYCDGVYPNDIEGELRLIVVVKMLSLLQD